MVTIPPIIANAVIPVNYQGGNPELLQPRTESKTSLTGA